MLHTVACLAALGCVDPPLPPPENAANPVAPTPTPPPVPVSSVGEGGEGEGGA